jgi:hypothetical protein
LLVWLAIQTPIVIAAFQYGHLSAEASREVLLIKDAVVAGLLLYLAARHWRSFKWQWFDLMAVIYTVTIVAYTVVAVAVGTPGTLTGTLSSARELLVPTELYALGRLAGTAGVDWRGLAFVFLAVSAAAAVFAVVQYLLGSPSFYSSTLDLVTFERQVQGFAGADNLWNISLLGDYGTGAGEYFRAVGTFTHPVGTAHYFVLPLALSVAMAFFSRGRQRLLAVSASVLFALVIVFTISRGTWMAAGLAVLACGFFFRRTRYATLAVAVAIVLVALTPPFSTSITSVFNGTDSSATVHASVVQHAVDNISQNIGQDILGIGMGQADKFGSVDLTVVASELGQGENTYLSIFINAGPVALVTFVLLGIGLIGSLATIRKATSANWASIAVVAALIGYAVSAMTSSPLMRFTTSASFWLFAGLVVVAGGVNGRSGWRSWAMSLVRRIWNSRNGQAGKEPTGPSASS